MENEELNIKLTATLRESINQFNQLTGSASNFDKVLTSIVYKTDETGKNIKGITRTTKALDGSSAKIKEVMNGSGTVISKTFTKAEKATKSFGDSFKSVFSLNKLYAFMNSTKFIRVAMGNLVQSSIDYIETQNKFNMSMGNAKPEAVLFVNQITEAVGIAKDELMDYMSTYKNILSGLGNFTDKESEKISESLTKMALDYSSLFNVSTSSAMNKFQSALTGSIRPIRSDSGFDVSDTTIGAKAKELGLDRTVGQLNQMEKRILRIIVLMDQMKNTGAFGDLARTIEQPSNQLKILQNQLRETGVWLGNVFMGTLGKVLPYINGFVMAMKEVIKLFALFVGYQADNSDLGDIFETVDEASGGIASNLGSASDSAKELKKTLMGFDVLNVITTPKESKGSGGGGVGSIDPAILNSLSQYDSLMENVRMKATDIRDRIMEWLGFTKIINPLTGEIDWYLNEGYQKIEMIRDAILTLGGVFAGWVIFKNWDKIQKAFTWIDGLFSKAGLAKALPILGKFLAVVGAVYGAVKLWQWATDDAVKSTDKLAGTTEDTVQRLVPVQDAFDDLVEIVTNVSYDGLALTEDEKQKIISSIDTLTEQLKFALQDYTDESIRQLNYLYYELGLISEEEYNAKLAQLQEYHNAETEEINKQAEALKESTQNLYDENGNIRMDAYAEWLMDLEEFENRSLDILTVSEDDKKKIREGADKASLEEKKKYYSQLFTGYATDRDNAINTAKEKYEKTLEYAKNTYGETSTEYQALQEKAKEIYDQEVLDAQTKYDALYAELKTSQEEIADYIDKDTGKVKSNWTKMWEDINKKADEVLGDGDSMGRKFITGLSKAFLNAVSPTSGILLAVADLAKKITSVFKGNVDLSTEIRATNSGGGGIRGYATGGLPDVGQLFVAREAGPELVGKIGSSNAVMNNNQIVQAVSQGVAQAVSSVLGQGAGNQVIKVMLDGYELASATSSRQSRMDNIYGTV